MTEAARALIEDCEAAVSEVLLAWRLCCPEGAMLNGSHLLAWRSLPARERSYFAALLAPYEDRHAMTRTQTSALTENGCVFTYDPPYAEPCECGRPVYVDYMRDAVRCSRCLHAWPARRQLAQGKNFDGIPSSKILESVDRTDIGFAIERVLT
jgi:hypothetical protein